VEGSRERRVQDNLMGYNNDKHSYRVYQIYLRALHSLASIRTNSSFKYIKISNVICTHASHIHIGCLITNDKYFKDISIRLFLVLMKWTARFMKR